MHAGTLRDPTWSRRSRGSHADCKEQREERKVAHIHICWVGQAAGAREGYAVKS